MGRAYGSRKCSNYISPGLKSGATTLIEPTALQTDFISTKTKTKSGFTIWSIVARKLPLILYIGL